MGRRVNILDPRFKYTPSHATNLKATFARIRRELKQKPQPAPNVRAITPPRREKHHEAGKPTNHRA